MSPTQIEGIVPHNQSLKKGKVGQHKPVSHRAIPVTDDDLLQTPI